LTGRRSLAPLFAAATGIATFSLMDMFMKSASIATGVYPALLLRNAAATLIILPLWLWQAGRWPDREALKLHALRSLIVAAMSALFFWGLVRVPMAEAIAISFVSPLLALYFASVLLGERIAAGAIVASLVGFAGICVVAIGRLTDAAAPEHSGAGMAAILLSAVFYAINLIIQRKQAQLASPFDVAFFQSLIVGLVLLAAWPVMQLAQPGLELVLPRPGVLAQIVAAGALAGISLVLLTWGYARAEAQVLLPLEYSGFAWAALLGWMRFGEPVTPATLAGTALIVIGSWLAARKPPNPHIPAAPPP